MHELTVVDALDIVRLDRVREAGLEGSNTGNFPTANREVFRAVDIAREFLAPSKRQLIHIAGDEP